MVNRYIILIIFVILLFWWFQEFLSSRSSVLLVIYLTFFFFKSDFWFFLISILLFIPVGFYPFFQSWHLLICHSHIFPSWTQLFFYFLPPVMSHNPALKQCSQTTLPLSLPSFYLQIHLLSSLLSHIPTYFFLFFLWEIYLKKCSKKKLFAFIDLETVSSVQLPD